MGITLHAIVERWFPPNEWQNAGHWENVCSWEFNKNYPFSHALYYLGGSTPASVSAIRPWPTGSKECISFAAKEVLDEDIGHGYQLVTSTELRRAIESIDTTDGDWSRERPAALLAAVRVLADCSAILGHGDAVRILFYRS